MMYLVFGVIPYFILRLLFLKKTADKWLCISTGCFCRFLLFIAGVKLNSHISPEAAKMIEQKKPVCFVSNHTSMLDIPAAVCVTGVNIGFIAKFVLAFVPLINIYAAALGCVFIDRKNRKRSVRAVAKGTEKVKKGHSMLIFPEGTRSKTGDIADFKHGSFRLAADADAYIVPITLKGLRQALEDRKKVFGKYEAFCTIGKPVLIKKEDSREIRFEKINDIEKNIRETYASLGDK